MRRMTWSQRSLSVRLGQRVGQLAPTALALAVGLVLAGAAWPEPAHAVDLFPVDDWVGDGLSRAGDVVLGPLKLGAKEIARLLATIVGALADLLVPKSFVRAGLNAIKWLVELPPVGASARPQPGVPDVRMPHLVQLRETMTWIGLTLMPLGLVVSGARAFLAPTSDGDSPADVLSRVITAGVGLLVYDWAWGMVTGLSGLLTSGLLGLPWVADGVETMLQTLVIGGATGSAVAAEFVVPLIITAAGTVLLGLLLVRVGLEVATAVLYVTGGLVLGVSVSSFGRRLLSAWLIAATAIVLLPLMWAAVFATGAALMLDAGASGGHRGFAAFVAQLYNVTAALAVFWIAIKLALGVFRHASGAMTAIATAPSPVAAGAGARVAGGARLQALAQNATPAGLIRFSRGLRGALAAGAGYPLRHPVRSAQAASYPLRRPVQATREAAAGLSNALAASRTAAGSAAQRVGDWRQRKPDGGRLAPHDADAPPATPARGADATGTAVPARTEPPRSAAGTPNGDRAASSRSRSGTTPPRPASSVPPVPSPRRETPPGVERASQTPPDGAPSSVSGGPSTPPAVGVSGSASARPLWWWRVGRGKRAARERKEPK